MNTEITTETNTLYDGEEIEETAAETAVSDSEINSENVIDNELSSELSTETITETFEEIIETDTELSSENISEDEVSNDVSSEGYTSITYVMTAEAETYTIMDKPLNEYTVSEGLLLIIMLILLFDFIIKHVCKLLNWRPF